MVDLLQRRAASQPDAQAYTFLLDGETREVSLTYGQLEQRVRAIGGFLAAAGARGERVLLLFAPGLEYMTAVLGCLHAGAVAIPAYPPDPSRLDRTLPRLAALVSDARAAFALTTAGIRSVADVFLPQARSLAALRWLSIEEATHEHAAAWQDPGASSDTLALLQYTSGSTGAPRGVMLSHGNLLHNSAAIYRCFGHGEDSRGVIWLPPYHDMGLIGGVLQPLFGGFPVVLLSPLDFLARPVRWLRAISRYRATTSGGPNFAYDLCVRKVSEAERAELDLGSWDLAFNGAEPVQAETLERFTRTFAPCGFRREAFYPCYGLAEGTLIVTGGRKAAAIAVRHFHKEALERGEGCEQADAGPEARAFVGCGTSLPDQELLIVDAATRRPLGEGRIGEIWVRGPSVAQGYWSRPEETEASFQACPCPYPVDLPEKRYLRTGDLGFLRGGELFVTGRIKDLLVVRGRNHYPQDIERTALACHPALRPGSSAAFSVEVEGEERIVLVQEVDLRQGIDAPAMLDAIRQAVAAEHEVQLHAIVLTAPGSLPKTSSGKIQRHACRTLFLAGQLAAVATNVLPVSAGGEAPRVARLTRQALLGIGDAEGRWRALLDDLRERVARIVGLPEAALDPGRPLTAFGLDSIRAVEFAGALDEELGIPLPLSFLLDGTSVTALAERILAELSLPASAAPLRLEPLPEGAEIPLSHAQERLLFLEELAPGNAAYHIAAAAMLDGRLDLAALERSLDAIVRRHAVLRARFPLRGGRRVQEIVPAEAAARIELAARVEDLTDRPVEVREQDAMRLALAEARRPLDLARGPIQRFRLFRLAEDRHLLVITLHHIAADGWSMGLLVRELGSFYAAFLHGERPPRPELTVEYGDFAAWQRRILEAGHLEGEIVYWKRQLGGAPPFLEWPADPARRPRPETQTFAGARHPFSLSVEVTAALKNLARAEEVTMFMILLAGWLVVLHAHTGRTDLVVGTDIANRDPAQTQRIIGLFVNQLVLRCDVSGEPTFRELLGRVRRTALGAYAHHHLPFGKLVEALRPPRDPRYNPLFQVMFVLENAPMPLLALPGLQLQVLKLDDGGSPFDLSILLSETAGALGGVLRYNTDLFEAESIARGADDFRAVLEAVAGRPTVSLAELRGLLAARDEQRQQARLQALKAARSEKFRSLRRE